MFTVVGDHVFPFLRNLGGNVSTYARHMKDARFTITTPALLAKVVDLIAQVPMEDRDTKADIAAQGYDLSLNRYKEVVYQEIEHVPPKQLLAELAKLEREIEQGVKELERMLIEAGVGTTEDLSRAKRESEGLGLFIRSLVGLDREAAKHAFGRFLSGKTSSANQIEFVNLIIDHLTEHGVMDPGLLYGSPFTDINPRGPEGVFPSSQVDELVTLLAEIRQRAAA